MKILFLDCDGVLNRRPTPDELSGKERHGMSEKEFENSIVGLNPILVANLKRIVDETDCKIVASTSWRYFEDHPTVGSDWRKTLSDMIGRDKRIFIGNTPILEFDSNRRGNEIKTWFENNVEPGTTMYCVVDDDISDIVGVIPRKRIVKTDPSVGLTNEDASRIIDILNGDSVNVEKTEHKWNTRFLELAEFIAAWSHDPSTKVGAVIVDKDRRIVSTGYNCLARGVKDTSDRLDNREVKYKIILHAEENAIMFSKQNLEGCSLYVSSMPPCSHCASLIIQSGIKTVYTWKQDIPDRWVESYELTRQMFKESGVKLIFVGK